MPEQTWIEKNLISEDNNLDLLDFLKLSDCTPIKEWIEEFEKIEGFINKNQANIISKSLIKHLIIGSCGCIEKTCKYLIHTAVTDEDTSDLILHFLEKNLLDKSLNPKHDQICGILKHYNSNWSKELKRDNYKKKKNVKTLDSLDSLVSLRNSIAHGNSESITRTKDEIKEYFIDSILVLNEINKIINKKS